jgi:hypothetical protein
MSIITEADIEEAWAKTKQTALRLVRSAILMLVATWLSIEQGWFDYSEWRIALLVFLLGALNRFQWIAGVLVLWLVALYLVPPQMVAALKAAW